MHVLAQLLGEFAMLGGPHCVQASWAIYFASLAIYDFLFVLRPCPTFLTSVVTGTFSALPSLVLNLVLRSAQFVLTCFEQSPCA